jgi:hypothetical protein
MEQAGREDGWSSDRPSILAAPTGLAFLFDGTHRHFEKRSHRGGDDAGGGGRRGGCAGWSQDGSARHRRTMLWRREEFQGHAEI